MENYIKYAIVIFVVIAIAVAVLQLGAKGPTNTTSILPSAISTTTPVTSSGVTTILTSPTTSSFTTAQTTTIQPGNTLASANKYNNSFITFNPINLSQMLSITKFRSCEGHDASGLDLNGTLEPFSSMKHYLQPLGQYAGSAGKIPIFSPFQGNVLFVLPTNPTRGQELDLQGNFSGNWLVIIFHIDPLAFIKNGTSITPGELLGYANLVNGTNFDIALESFPMYQKAVKNYSGSRNFSQNQQNNYRTNLTLDTMFSHLSPNVSAQYQKFGVTPGGAVISLSYRQAYPCQCIGQSQPNCHFQNTQKSNDFINFTSH